MTSLVSGRFSWSRSCAGCDVSSWGRDYKVSWPRIIQRGRLKVLQLLRSQDSLSSKSVTHTVTVWNQYVLMKTMYDGYDSGTFLMFVPNICIISSHKLSSDRIRHESDMRTSSSIHALSDASLKKSAEHDSSFTIISYLLAWLGY